jgi:hypothetical protein
VAQGDGRRPSQSFPAVEGGQRVHQRQQWGIAMAGSMIPGDWSAGCARPASVRAELALPHTKAARERSGREATPRVPFLDPSEIENPHHWYGALRPG